MPGGASSGGADSRYRPPAEPFAVLGLPTSASRDEVKAAFRRAALRCHPDIDHSPQAAARFAAIKRAADQILRVRGSSHPGVAGCVNCVPPPHTFPHASKHLKNIPCTLCALCRARGPRALVRRTVAAAAAVVAAVLALPGSNGRRGGPSARIPRCGCVRRRWRAGGSSLWVLSKATSGSLEATLG